MRIWIKYNKNHKIFQKILQKKRKIKRYVEYINRGKSISLLL